MCSPFFFTVMASDVAACILLQIPCVSGPDGTNVSSVDLHVNCASYFFTFQPRHVFHPASEGPPEVEACVMSGPVMHTGVPSFREAFPRSEPDGYSQSASSARAQPTACRSSLHGCLVAAG